MFRLLKFLITGDWHLHKWETVEESFFEYHDSNDSLLKQLRLFRCKCSQCGIHKTFKEKL